MERHRAWLPLTASAVFWMLAAATSSPAGTYHDTTAVSLRDANNSVVTSTTPYSPKATCGRCHNYGTEEQLASHTQGVLEPDNKVYWQTYDVKFFDHGVSKGRHSNQGRNENYSTAMRTAFGDPFFTSSPGMFGKY